MEIREALTIVRKLADGVHPETGEVVQADCLYNHPQAVRALHRAVEALECRRDITQGFQRVRTEAPSRRNLRPWNLGMESDYNSGFPNQRRQ